jgi:3-oxoacyl-[acyl-carrier protein] reductase
MAGNQGSPPRVAIVTGGSRGIGRRCVERLADDGTSIVVGFGTNEAEAHAAVAAAEGRGAKAVAVRADVADAREVTGLFDGAVHAFGGVDVVVHAAGRLALAPVVDLELEVLDDLLRTNVRGTFVVAQQAARRVRPGGSILNFSSSVIGRLLPGYAAYAATKGAVEAMTLILAAELGERDINVNAVAPGPTATAMFLEGKDDETIARFAGAIPLGRIGTPTDIAEVVAFLTSPAGHWVNGQTLRANGGIN